MRNLVHARKATDDFSFCTNNDYQVYKTIQDRDTVCISLQTTIINYFTRLRAMKREMKIRTFEIDYAAIASLQHSSSSVEDRNKNQQFSPNFLFCFANQRNYVGFRVIFFMKEIQFIPTQ